MKVAWALSVQNTAKSVTATCTVAGTYTFRATATDVSNRTATSEVIVTVKPNAAFSVPPTPVANG